MNALARDALEARRGERVLEIGFGGGALLRALSADGALVSGVDTSAAMVARSKRSAVHLAPVDALPFPAASFDKAVSLNSLYFWPDPEAAMAELARVVRPGGRLVLAFEPPEELRKWPGHRFGFRLFEVAEVRELMEQAGFGEIAERWGTGRRPDRFCGLSGIRLAVNG
jgi:SAM-dependent methyltransferase